MVSERPSAGMPGETEGHGASAAGVQYPSAAGPDLGLSLDDVERVLLAQLHFAGGDFRAGLAVALGSPEAGRGLSLVAARAHFALGERDRAFAILERWLVDQPAAALPLYYRAQFLSQAGQPREAVAALRRLIGATPDFPGALLSLAQWLFPGPPYRDFLKRVHDALRPRTYLEIGVEHGTTLALAVHSAHAVGVDPVPRPPTRELPRAARSYHQTSDDFFAAHQRRDVFGDDLVDLAFIDGMHWFEYALRDFHHVERWCGPNSTVILHDCLPSAPVAAARQRQTNFWVGDTWKALEFLLRERPELQISIVPTYPSGLVVVRNLDPGAGISDESLAAWSSAYPVHEYPYDPGSWPSHYPMVPNAEPHLSELLAELRATSSGLGRRIRG